VIWPSVWPFDQADVIAARTALSSFATPLANDATRLVRARSIQTMSAFDSESLPVVISRVRARADGKRWRLSAFVLSERRRRVAHSVTTRVDPRNPGIEDSAKAGGVAKAACPLVPKPG
jgi:hypothetical protein